MTIDAYWGGGEIELSPRASTRTKLHELAHMKFGHELGGVEAGVFVDREIDAESYAWEMMDKEPNHRVGVPALVDLIQRFEFTVDEALGLVVKRLRMKGIEVSRAGHEDLRRLAEL